MSNFMLSIHLYNIGFIGFNISSQKWQKHEDFLIFVVNHIKLNTNEMFRDIILGLLKDMIAIFVQFQKINAD